MEKIVLAAIVIAVVALAIYLLVIRGILPSPAALFDALRTCSICPSFQLP